MADKLFEEALLEIINNKKDKALVFVEAALSEWPEGRVKAAHESELALYFAKWLRQARSELYARDYGKKKQEGSGGENG